MAPGNGVQVNFNQFKLTTSDDCNDDYLEIREQNSFGKLLGTFCGSDIPSNITTKSNMWLLFNSANRTAGTSGVTETGFLATYTLGKYISFPIIPF